MSWQNLNLFLSFFREMTHGYNDESREFIIKLKIKRTPPLDTFWKNFISWGIVCKIFATLPWTVSQQVAVCEISRYCWDLGMAANLDYFSNPVSNQISDFISGLNLDFGWFQIQIWSGSLWPLWNLDSVSNLNPGYKKVLMESFMQPKF